MSNTSHKPISMEDYFQPNIRTKPALHVGSQTHKFFKGIPKEQAWEGFHLIASKQHDIAVVRDFDPEYISYWQRLMGGKSHVINLSNTDQGKFLTQILLEEESFLEQIKKKMKKNSQLMVFLPTLLEEKLAEKLKIPLHGRAHISKKYGTKSGIRELAKSAHIPMPQGYIARSLREIEEATQILKKSFDEAVIKHDHSVSGYFSKKISTKQKINVGKLVKSMLSRPFQAGKDVFVVEGWVKSKASLCAHIEIFADGSTILASGWQQIIDTDDITYLGGGPLTVSKRALASFIEELKKLAAALKKKGAVGSFGPDFIVVAPGQKDYKQNTCLLIELNARIPYTALSLEAVKHIKGKIGTGFYSRQVNLSRPLKFKDIKEMLLSSGLLFMDRKTQKSGVIPFNIGLLPWNIFDVLIIGKNWKAVQKLNEKVTALFN